MAKVIRLPDREDIVKRMWRLANAGAEDAVRLACFPPEEWQGVDKLELDVQGIIKLRFFEEMSLKEIAGITGFNLNTVKTKLYRGLKLLKENIEEADL